MLPDRPDIGDFDHMDVRRGARARSGACGLTGTYHHVSQQHLKRYLAEFDFRHNARSALGVDDQTRAARLIRGIVGKRLMYKDSSPAPI